MVLDAPLSASSAGTHAFAEYAVVAKNAFPRRARLLSPAQYKRVFKKPVISSDRFFRVLARLRDEGAGEIEPSRLGLVVSRRIDPRATGRNRIKRIVRESFRCAHTPAIAAQDESGQAPESGQAHDYVVQALEPARIATNSVLRKSLGDHWLAIERKTKSGIDANSAGK